MADLVSLTVFRKVHLPRVPKAHCSKTEGAVYGHYNELIELLLRYNVFITFYLKQIGLIRIVGLLRLAAGAFWGPKSTTIIYINQFMFMVKKFSCK